LKPVIILSLAMLLPSCAVVGPDYIVPVTAVPAAWNAAQPGTTSMDYELSGWWTRLSDPLLSQFIERALAGNINLRHE